MINFKTIIFLVFVLAPRNCLGISKRVAKTNSTTDTFLMSPDNEYKCTGTNINQAGLTKNDRANDPNFLVYMNNHGMYIGYPEGSCGFVKTQSSCEPEGNFDFLKLYYCSLPVVFGNGWALFLFGGIVICVS